MIIKDRLYGKTNIKSKVIVELIESKPMQRLKGIAQFGIPDDFYHLKNYYRYEHSVGVMILLKKLGASEEEQVAGLLHDVSHTAFSHIIDWVIGDGKTEDHQDEQHFQYISNSEIPEILKKYNYSVENIVDYHRFGLLERDLPDLCADRVDYSLREFPASVVKICLPALRSKNNKIVFANKKAALLFARNFLKRQAEHWGGFESASRYRIFANVLRQALKEEVITEDDFWQNDKHVVDKLNASQSEKIQKVLRILRSKSLTDLERSSTKVHKKFRYVDPLFIQDSRLVRLSSVSQEFTKELEKCRQDNEVGVTIPSVSGLMSYLT